MPLFLALSLVSKFKTQVTLAGGDHACVLKLEEANPLNLEIGIGPNGADYLAFPQLERESRDHDISPELLKTSYACVFAPFEGSRLPRICREEKRQGE